MISSEDRAPSDAEAGERINAVKRLFDEYQTMSIAAADGGEPWVAKVFFIEDEPDPGRLDLCSAMIVSSRKLAMLRANPKIAFVVAGDEPVRWAQGTGDVDFVGDASEMEAIGKALAAKSPSAGPFLSLVPWNAVRIHVRRLKYTDVAMRPPVAEFTFE